MAPLRVSNERVTLIVLLPILLPATLLAGPQATPPPAASPVPTVPPAPTAAAVPGPAGLEVLWTASWDEAVKAVQKIPGGRILIYFSDDDCGQCRRMEALVVPSTSFYAYTRDKIPLYLKFSSPEGKKLAAQLRVKEIPAWVVVTPDLLITGRQVGPTSQIGWVEEMVRGEQGWDAYKALLEREKAEPGNAAVVFDVARETFERGGDSLAEPRFARLAADSRTPQDLKEKSLAYLATIEMDAGRPDLAAGHLDQLLATGKDPALKQRAALRRAEVEIARGRKDLAIGRLKAFKAEWPDSPLVRDADALLEALGGSETPGTGSPK